MFRSGHTNTGEALSLARAPSRAQPVVESRRNIKERYRDHDLHNKRYPLDECSSCPQHAHPREELPDDVRASEESVPELSRAIERIRRRSACRGTPVGWVVAAKGDRYSCDTRPTRRCAGRRTTLAPLRTLPDEDCEAFLVPTARRTEDGSVRDAVLARPPGVPGGYPLLADISAPRVGEPRAERTAPVAHRRWTTSRRSSHPACGDRYTSTSSPLVLCCRSQPDVQPVSDLSILSTDRSTSGLAVRPDG